MPHADLAIATALTLRAALRRTGGLIGSLMPLLGLNLSAPDHSTTRRRAETRQLPRLASGSGARPTHLLVDSTGLKLSGRASGWSKSTAHAHAVFGAGCISPGMLTQAGSSWR
jgi:hypothetical protein